MHSDSHIIVVGEEGPENQDVSEDFIDAQNLESHDGESEHIVSSGDILKNQSAHEIESDTRQDNLNTQRKSEESSTIDNKGKENAVKDSSISTSAEKELKSTAKLLYEGALVSVNPMEYTQYLCGSDEESSKIRYYFMRNFTWDVDLLNSTRMLCKKIYMKAESQELDRLLSDFAKSYLEQYPKNPFGTENHEKIYIVLYSLILLNTSLHNIELNRRNKISQANYIKNTLTTFLNQGQQKSSRISLRFRLLLEQELGKYYQSLTNEELELKHLSDVNDENDYLMSSKEISPTVQEITEVGQKISKQNSHDSSIWSMDSSSKRNSIYGSRISSGASRSRYAYQNSRVGFTRALLSDGNSSIASPEFPYIRNGNQVAVGRIPSRATVDTSDVTGKFSLDKKGSRSSIISKVSMNIDDMSLLTLTAEDLEEFDFGELAEFADASTIFQTNEYNADDFTDQYDLTLELQGSPFLKEGILKVKVLNGDEQEENDFIFDQSSTSASASSAGTSSTTSRIFSFFRSRSELPAGNSSRFLNKTQECFVVVSKGVLSMYTFDDKIIKKYKQKRNRTNDFFQFEESSKNKIKSVGDGNWLNNAVCIGAYNLCSTFADFKSRSRNDTVFWYLEFPRTSKREPKKILFEAGTNKIAQEFVSTCNFWASKITAIPALEESLSSIDYGWTNVEALVSNKQNFKKLKIPKWQPLPKGVYLSSYVVETASDLDTPHSGVIKQLIKTSEYYSKLIADYKSFKNSRHYFVKNMSEFRGALLSSNYSKTLANYDHRLKHYRQEVKKYRSYLVLLAYAVKLRFQLEALDDKNDAHVNNISSNNIKKLIAIQIEKILKGAKGVDSIVPFSNLDKTEKLDHNSTPNNDINNRTNNTLDEDEPFPLVRSPKTFTLSNFNENEPAKTMPRTINAVANCSEVSHSFSTGTIEEEEEEEEAEEKGSSVKKNESEETSLIDRFKNIALKNEIQKSIAISEVK